MITWETERVRTIMLEAGRTALKFFAEPETEHKADRSLVTAADTAVEQYLRQALADDDAGFIGEESALSTTDQEIQKLMKGVTWVVDPIDGTAPYANGLSTWGVSVGLMHDGVLQHGALFLPRTGELFLSHDDAILYQRECRDPECWAFENLRPMEPVEQPYSTMGMISLPQEMRRSGSYNGGNPFQCNGSAVYSVARTLTGNYLGYVARIRLWDIAGSIPLLARLGYQVVLSDGTLLRDHVPAGDWNLTAHHPALWKCRGLLHIGRDGHTIEHLRRHYSEDAPEG